MSAYFERIDHSTFRATPNVQGAWNIAEQHVAPALGLLVHAIENEHLSRREDGLELARVSFDILGVLPIDVVEISVRVLRPGRTIELVEATLSHLSRPAVTARAWWMKRTDTSTIAGSALAAMPPRETFGAWDPSSVWPGNYVTTVEVRRQQFEPGWAQFWLRPRLVLLDGEPISPTARLLGLVDVANGMAVRTSPDTVAFPNLDLTAHLLRPPVGDWIGFETTVNFGPDGIGFTHSVLHDEQGPVGTSVQSLTIRPL